MKRVFLLLYCCLIVVAVVSTPRSVQAQEASENELLLFVSEGCPHCEEVEKFITQYDLEEEVIIKDTRSDPQIAAEYNDLSEKAGIPIEDRGVPILFDGEVHFSGDKPIIEYLQQKFNITPETPPTETKDTTVVWFILGGGVILALGSIYLTKRNG